MFQPHPTENITPYVKSIGKHAILSKQDEISLFKQLRGNDIDISNKARETIICSNLRLVVKIAHTYKHYGLPLDDLVAEGNCGLLTAVDKFDNTKNVRFSCYAGYWITQNIRRALSSKARTIRLPVGVTQSLAKIIKLKESYTTARGETPTTEELSQLSGYSESTITSLERADLLMCSLDEPIREHETTTLGAFISNEHYSDPTQSEDSNLLTHLEYLLDNLSDKDKFIITAKFGLNNTMVLDNLVISQETGIPVKHLALRTMRILSQLREGISA